MTVARPSSHQSGGRVMECSRSQPCADAKSARTEAEPSASDSNPFVTAPCGGSLRTATSACATSTGATTAAGSRAARRTSLSGRATRSSCAQLVETLPLFGGAQSTGGTDRKASNAPSSATRVRTSRPSLSDRLTASLITSGLVCGITPSSMRKLSGVTVEVLAFAMPDGARSGATASALKGGC
jgi:hypothetical protein